MLNRILKQYIFRDINCKSSECPVFLAVLWNQHNTKNLISNLNEFVEKLTLEDDEILFIKNRKDTGNYVAHINSDFIIIDEQFHVFPMNSRIFGYLFTELKNAD